MINVILPVTANAEEFFQFVGRECGASVRFYVGVREKLAEVFKNGINQLKNAEVHVFSDRTTREEMINSLSKAKMRHGKVIIVRRVLNEFEFSALKNSETDITSMNSKHKPLFKLFKKLGEYVVKKLFSFSFYEDISALAFGEDMFELVSTCKNLSTASRINRFVGVSESVVETSQKPVSKEFNKRRTISLFVLAWLFCLGSFAGGLSILILCNLPISATLVIVLWFIIAVLVLCVGVINFTRSLVVGDLKIGMGEEYPTILKPKKDGDKLTSEKKPKMKAKTTK